MSRFVKTTLAVALAASLSLAVSNSFADDGAAAANAQAPTRVAAPATRTPARRSYRRYSYEPGGNYRSYGSYGRGARSQYWRANRKATYNFGGADGWRG